jgi:hypothetical protein
VLLLELWTWLSCAVFLVWPNVYVLTASILPTAIAFPSTDSVVHGYGIAMTPDRLLAPSLDELAELPGRAVRPRRNPGSGAPWSSQAEAEALRCET